MKEKYSSETSARRKTIIWVDNQITRNIHCRKLHDQKRVYWCFAEFVV